MKGSGLVFILILLLEIEGAMLKCGEDIIVQRGEKKKVRFWSTDDELMKVEVLPEREQSDGSAFLAIFKDLNTKPSSSAEKSPVSDHFDRGGDWEKEAGLSQHLASRSDLSDDHEGDGKPAIGDYPSKSVDEYIYREETEEPQKSYGEPTIGDYPSKSVDEYIYREETEEPKESFDEDQEEIQVDDNKEQKAGDTEIEREEKPASEQDDVGASYAVSEKEDQIQDVEFSNDTEVTNVDYDESKKDNEKNPVTEGSIDASEPIPISNVAESLSASAQEESDSVTVKSETGQGSSDVDELSYLTMNKTANFSSDTSGVQAEALLIPEIVRKSDDVFETDTIITSYLTDNQEIETNEKYELKMTTIAYENDQMYNQEENVDKLSNEENFPAQESTVKDFEDSVTTSQPSETSTNGEGSKPQKEINKDNLGFQQNQDTQIDTYVKESLLKQDEIGIDEIEVGSVTSQPDTTNYILDFLNDESSTVSHVENEPAIESLVWKEDIDIELAENTTLAGENGEFADSLDLTTEDNSSNLFDFIDQEDQDQANSSSNLRENIKNQQFQTIVETDLITATEDTSSVTEDDKIKGTDLGRPTTDKSLDQSQDELIVVVGDSNNSEKKDSEHFVKDEIQDGSQQTNAPSTPSDKDSPDGEKIKSHITSSDQELGSNKEEPILPEKTYINLQNPDDFSNQQEEFGNQELKNIMTQLKSQEALLSRPSLRTDEFQTEHLQVEGDDTASIDIKINILKNIIKGIASQIATSEKSGQDVILNPTDLLHETNLNQETSHYLTMDELPPEVFNSHVKDDSILISEELNQNHPHRKDEEEPTQYHSANISINSSSEDTKTNESTEFETTTTGEVGSKEHFSESENITPSESQSTTEINRDEGSTETEKNSDLNRDDNMSSPNENEITTEVNRDEMSTRSENEKTTAIIKDYKIPTSDDSSETSHGIVKEMSSVPLEKTNITLVNNDIETGENVTEATTGLVGELKKAYNQILNGLFYTSTASADTEPELETELLETLSQEKSETSDDVSNPQNVKVLRKDLVTSENEVHYKEDSKSSNENVAVLLKETANSPAITNTKGEEEAKPSLNYEHTTSALKLDESKKEKGDKSDLEEIFIPFNFLNLGRITTADEAEKESATGHPNYLETTISSLIEDVDTTSVSLDKTVEIKDDDSIKNNQHSEVLGEKNEKETNPVSKYPVAANGNQESGDTDKEDSNRNTQDKNGNDEAGQEIKVINENAVFSKETGSNSILSLIRNALLSQNNKQLNKDTNKENIILIPFNLKSKKDSEPSKVIIEEQGSKVVIIKPQTVVTSNKEEISFLSNTTTKIEDQNESVFDTTTRRLQEMEEDELGLETTAPYNFRDDLRSQNDTDTADSEDIMSTSPVIKNGEDQVVTYTESTQTETYVSFGIIKEDETTIAPIQNLPENMFPTPAPLMDTSTAHTSHKVEETSLNSENIASESPSFIRKDPGVIELLENYVLGETALHKLLNEDREPSSLANSPVSNAHYESDISIPKVPLQANNRLQNGQETFGTRMDDILLVEKEPSDDSLFQPIPYVLQTRKGFLASNAPEVEQGNMPQHRRDDSQYPYGGDSPFFIKLPGSPNAVPVFLQYEPVEVKYVDLDKYLMKKPVVPKSETGADAMGNNVRASSPGTSIRDNTKTKDKFKYSAVDKSPSNSQEDLDFHDRPDPFFLMEPPNLGKDADQASNDLLPEKENHSFSVDLKGNLNFDDKKKIPAVVTGDKAVSPGEYFIKNPDNSYSSSDTTHLTNSVFSLGSKVLRPTPEPDKPQYTPFPLTANPPRITTSSDEDSYANQNATTLASDTLWTITSSTLTPTSAQENVTVNVTDDEDLPSMEFSPAPSIDYRDSFGPYIYSDVPFSEDADEDFFEDDPNLYPLAYENKNAEDETQNKEVLQNSEPKLSRPFVPHRSSIPPKEEESFDIVALANFLHQNQKVWSNPKVSNVPESSSWRGPLWDSEPIKYSDGNDDKVAEPPFGTSPWLAPEGSLGEGRDYSAFYSPEEIPGLDPAYFSYRSVPFDTRETRGLNPEVEGIVRYLQLLPKPIRKAVMGGETSPGLRRTRSVAVGEHIYCEWNIKTEPGLYLLVTFHNLSAPYSIDCHGAYIEVERENNGYDARWCGNRAIMDGSHSRPHVIFAKTEVRITVYDNGDSSKAQSTGFEAEIEVIDLFNKHDYNTFLEKKASPKIRRLLRG